MRQVGTAPAVLITALVALASVGVLAPQPALAQSLGVWTQATHYPISVGELSCDTSGGFVYCVGGEFNSKNTNASYYAPLSSSGVGAWIKTTDYPIGIDVQTCDASNGLVYCVGGYDRGSDKFTKAVYFAAASASGVGAWTRTNDYPIGVIQQSCDATGEFIYCVGGEVGTYGNVTKAVYFASVSPPGVDAWVHTTDYPVGISVQSCVISGGFIYCVGGSGKLVYYAPISSSGVGAWTKTTDYPILISDQSCDISDGFIYCVGGTTGPYQFPTNAVYYAPISPSGVGAWTETTAYPLNLITHSCDTLGTSIYCVGGFDTSGNFVNSVYYSSIGSAPNTSTSTATTTSTLTKVTTSTSAAVTSSTTTASGPSVTSSTTSMPTPSTQQTTSSEQTGNGLISYLVVGAAIVVVAVLVGVVVVRRRR